MVSITEAKKVKSLIEQKMSGKTVFKIGKYKDGYLVIASDTNYDFNDPYYYVKDNNINHFLPFEDPDGVSLAFGKNKIYDNGKA